MPIFFLLAAAAGAAFLFLKKPTPAGSSAAHPVGAPGQPTTFNMPIDANLPPAYMTPITNAVARETDPNKLAAFAYQLAKAGYPTTSASMTARAKQLRPTTTGQTQVPSLLGPTGPRHVGFPNQPPPAPQPGPTLTPMQVTLPPPPATTGPMQVPTDPQAMMQLPLTFWLQYYAQ